MASRSGFSQAVRRRVEQGQDPQDAVEDLGGMPTVSYGAPTSSSDGSSDSSSSSSSGGGGGLLDRASDFAGDVRDAGGDVVQEASNPTGGDTGAFLDRATDPVQSGLDRVTDPVESRAEQVRDVGGSLIDEATDPTGGTTGDVLDSLNPFGSSGGSSGGGDGDSDSGGDGVPDPFAWLRDRAGDVRDEATDPTGGQTGTAIETVTQFVPLPTGPGSGGSPVQSVPGVGALASLFGLGGQGQQGQGQQEQDGGGGGGRGFLLPIAGLGAGLLALLGVAYAVGSRGDA